MPNDCWSHITITCENREAVDELNNLIINELKHTEEDKYVYHETVNMLKRGTRGIIFEIWSAWHPDYEWLESLLEKYPNCWVKNEWSEEGGFAGVWVGFMNNNKEKIIKDLQWDDICIEGKACLFQLEDEEEAKKEEEERLERINKKRAEYGATGKKIIKKVVS
jgi:hypothetical protein